MSEFWIFFDCERCLALLSYAYSMFILSLFVGRLSGASLVVYHHPPFCL